MDRKLHTGWKEMKRRLFIVLYVVITERRRSNVTVTPISISRFSKVESKTIKAADLKRPNRHHSSLSITLAHFLKGKTSSIIKFLYKYVLYFILSEWIAPHKSLSVYVGLRLSCRCHISVTPPHQTVRPRSAAEGVFRRT